MGVWVPAYIVDTRSFLLLSKPQKNNLAIAVCVLGGGVLFTYIYILYLYI